MYEDSCYGFLIILLCAYINDYSILLLHVRNQQQNRTASISLFALCPEHSIQWELWCKTDGAWFRPLTSNEVTPFTLPSECSLSYRWQIRRSVVRCGCCCFRHPRQGQGIKVNNKHCGGQWPLTGCWSPIHKSLRPCGCQDDSRQISATLEQIRMTGVMRFSD